MADEAIRQLLYFSKSTRHMSEEDLSDILRISRVENRKRGITGLLIFVGWYFIQCLEGTRDDIGQLLENIRNDGRNHEVTVLIDRPVDKRAFPEWNMGFRPVAETKLLQEAGFLNVTTGKDLENILKDEDEAIFVLMRTFYANNAPGD